MSLDYACITAVVCVCACCATVCLLCFCLLFDNEGMVKKITGAYKVSWHTSSGEEMVADFTPPFRRIDMMAELEKVLGDKLPSPEELNTPESIEKLKRLCAKNNVDCSPPLTAARLLDKLVGDFLEVQCISPTFIINHPVVMSPLSKW